MSERVFTCFFPFCGLGAGALGFVNARAQLFGTDARFRSLGGIDVDADACRDFERLTGSPALQADVATLTVAQLRAFAGETAPDVVFSSPPCKGYSGLLSESRSKGAKYQALNRLVLDWVEVMLAAWPTRPPRLFLIENVPRIATRGRKLLAEVKKLLRAAGYAFHASAHDCGEIGGLAQHRRRFLLVARHEASTPALLYQPPTQRVRGCGEVLEQLPLPGTPSAGPLHQLPKISMLNWIRLALIPPGGDWRDLPTDTREPNAREDATHRNKYVLVPWTDPTGAVIGATRPGSGAPSVADLRVRAAYPHAHGVLAWDEPSFTVKGVTWSPGHGAFSVADPRLTPRFNNVFTLHRWTDAAGAVNGGTGPTSGAASVADVRVRAAFDRAYQVLAWGAPAGTVRGDGTTPGAGPFSVADPRIVAGGGFNYANQLVLLRWDEAAHTITGGHRVGAGAQSIADPRLGPEPGSTWRKGKHHIMRWDVPSRTVIGGRNDGADAIADPRLSYYAGTLGVAAWSDSVGVVTGAAHPTRGMYSVADPRVRNFGAGPYGVLDWHAPSGTVTGNSWITAGAFAVADPRLACAPRSGAYGLLAWDAPAWTVTGSLQVDNGAAAVADPRVPGNPALALRYYPSDLRAAPPFAPVLPTADGTWHRPLTTLELAALQGLPTEIDGQPLTLAGRSATAWRERIGNAVPVPAALAIARQMLLTLAGADAERWALSSEGAVWVESPDGAPVELGTVQ